MNPTNKAVWQELKNHQNGLAQTNLRQLFDKDSERADNFSLQAEDIFIDYSKNIINETTIKLLLKLAKEQKVEEKRDKMFAGLPINVTEDRAVLHTALRGSQKKTLNVDGTDVLPQIQKVLTKMADFSNKIRSHQLIGYTGKPIKNIVNIGIGGSDLGPYMATEALKNYSQRDLTVKFVSNIDGTHLNESLIELDPAETLFIVASKTFTTDETMTNARAARKWLLRTLKEDSAVSKHFVALSTNTALVEEFGINPDNIFEFWDWVGGRYSMTSAIGLSIMIAVGIDNFNEMLRGFHDMDNHFLNTPLEKNAPVIMALISIWYSNFYQTRSEAILPYEQYLHKLPAYMQQVSMESNGKTVDLQGNHVNYSTGTVIWGEAGTNGQHAFYQLLHQGTQMIPCDFIGFVKSSLNNESHHPKLLANMLAQSEALAFGKTSQELESEGTKPELIPHKTFEGNRPSNTILAPKLTPRVLGQLISLYEHKTFVQGAIWNINSFDQWGVELGKKLAKNIYAEIESKEIGAHDSSTANLIHKIISHNKQLK